MFYKLMRAGFCLAYSLALTCSEEPNALHTHITDQYYGEKTAAPTRSNMTDKKQQLTAIQRREKMHEYCDTARDCCCCSLICIYCISTGGLCCKVALSHAFFKDFAQQDQKRAERRAAYAELVAHLQS